VKFKLETEFQDTEIGKMPRDWHIAKLGELIEMNHGKRPEIILQEGDVPIYGGGGFYGYTNTYLVDEPYILILARVGKGSVGKVYLARGKIWVTDNAIYGYSRDPSGIATVYAYYWLQFDRTWVERYVRRSAGGYAIITLNSLNNLKLPLPLLNEQKGIVETLSIIDKSIELHYKENEKLEHLKKALMRELLTGRIRVREENGKPIFYRETEFQETEIGKIPKEWRVKKLGELVFEIYYGLTAKAVDQPTELRMLRTTDIKDNYRVDWDSLPYCEITDNRRSNIQKYLLRKNDLVVSRAGTTGMSILVDKDLNDVIFGSYLIKIKLNESVAYPKFIHYFMQSSLYWNQLLPKQAGSTLKNISLPILKNILTPLPPINEQKLIPEILSTLDRTIELYHEERIRLERLKRGLMDLLLTGKIRVVEG
jgi:type I restriction enzyme S subunit